MPPKAKQTPKVWRPKGALDRHWVGATANRLDRVRLDLASSAAEMAGANLPTPPAPPTGGSSSSAPSRHGIEPTAIPEHKGLQPRDQPENPMEELAALRFARTSTASFAVQRHAVMVLGRPVVVLHYTVLIRYVVVDVIHT